MLKRSYLLRACVVRIAAKRGDCVSAYFESPTGSGIAQPCVRTAYCVLYLHLTVLLMHHSSLKHGGTKMGGLSNYKM